MKNLFLAGMIAVFMIVFSLIFNIIMDQFYHVDFKQPKIKPYNMYNNTFYIYNEKDLNINVTTLLCGNKEEADYLLLGNLYVHKNRVMDPSQADFFIIPVLPSCKPVWIDTAFQAITSNRWFNDGQKHLLFTHHYYYNRFKINKSVKFSLIQEKWISKLCNVTQTRYEYYGMSYWENSFKSHPEWTAALFSRKREITKHSIVTPYGTTLPITPPDYDQWRQRQYLIWYHTRTKPFDNGGNKVRQAPLHAKLNGSIGFSIEKSVWKKGWSNSKFCLVLRGDSPSSHAFSRAIAGACIPVVISDYFFVAIPFGMNISDFTVRIKERDYLMNPDINNYLQSIPEGEIRSKLNVMVKAQRQLLYHHPQSEIVNLVLRELASIYS